MIQANEIRVGNYLYDDKNKYFQLRQIGVGLIESCGMHIYEIEEVQPIELTEEILLKCGFEKKQSHINGVGLCVFFENKNFNYRLNEFFEVVLLKIKLKNLHQLQNLYFALTNEELNVKL